MKEGSQEDDLQAWLRLNFIHARKNDCILFTGEYKRSIVCHICGTSRFKEHNVPKKILRHFPLGPRVCHMVCNPSLL